MAIKEPESMDGLIYFTNRTIGDGKVSAWVYKGECPKCKKGIMSKPKNEKTGKPKIRAKEYVCSECDNVVDKEEFEETLMCEVKYVCPKCKKEGEAIVPFKRKNIKIFNETKKKDVTVKAVVFNCEHCDEQIPITKKLK